MKMYTTVTCGGTTTKNDLYNECMNENKMNHFDKKIIPHLVENSIPPKTKTTAKM